MKIKEYIDKYYSKNNKLGYMYNNHNITKVTSNSKDVTKGAVYCHLKNKDYLSYVNEAIKNGASTLFIPYDCHIKTKKNINIIKVHNPKIELARLNKEIYLSKYSTFPTFIGVTGTTGKTSVSLMIYNVLTNLDKDVLLIGSNGIYSYYAKTTKVFSTNNTTPNNEIIYKYINQHEMAYDYVVIEVSSQGLVDLRVLGIEFDYSIVTNFHQEHLEYHHTESNYLYAKLRLIYNTTKHLIIYNDIEYLNDFITCSIIPYTTYGTIEGDYKVKEDVSDLFTNKFILTNKNKHYLIETKLIGKTNMINICGTVSLLNTIGYPISTIINCINKINVIDGRMNLFNVNNRYVIVDYAHSKYALEQTLSYLKEKTMNKLIVVIGAGGLRDTSNRKFIGEITFKLCDYVVFTEDNSRSEKVEDIINDILYNNDLYNNQNYSICLCRKDAIDYALKISEENDVVAIIGKGNEDYIISDKIVLFNDVEYIKSLAF